jgi:hypothetical protein
MCVSSFFVAESSNGSDAVIRGAIRRCCGGGGGGGGGVHRHSLVKKLVCRYRELSVWYKLLTAYLLSLC